MPIERVAPELDRIVSADQNMEELGRGYSLSEGPLWWKEGGYLLFSEVNRDRLMKWAQSEGVSVFRDPPGNGNGLTRDPQGRLVAAGHGNRCVIRFENDGSGTMLANKYEGKSLNSPNDVVVRSDGSIYFTDPAFGIEAANRQLDYNGVFRVGTDGNVTLVASDFEGPNGLAFSPDESILYIDDSFRKHVRAFDVQADGTLANGRIFCDLQSDRPGAPDGMKVDVEGNVYCTGPGGVWVIDPSGKHLGTILTGTNQTTNCAWGGYDWKTLFITTMETMGRVQLKIAGIPVPR